MTAAAPDSRDPWIGEVLSGRYRLVAQIGAGGMGVVYRAWDLNDDRYVVVKMPKRELIGDPNFLMRFEQELSALKTLSHDSVVPIIDFGTESGTPFAVMPYLAGGSLKQRIRLQSDGQPKPDDPSMLWRWLPAIAHALDAVHANGFVHRDVKPDNILFDGLGRPYLSDFGVAKLVLQEEDAALTRGLTRTGFALGTPDYMAPELVSGAKPDAFVDQYALAVVVYELVCGTKPFRGPTPAAVMIAHVTTQATPVAAVRPGIPTTLSDAIARGIEKNPSARFGRCIEFAAGVLMEIPKPTAATKTKLMCPQCGRLLTVQHEWAGKKGSCPRCDMAITIGVDLHSLWIPGDREAVVPTAGEPSEQFSCTPPTPLDISISTDTPSLKPRKRLPPRIGRLLDAAMQWAQVLFLLATLVGGAGVAVVLLGSGSRFNAAPLRKILDQPSPQAPSLQPKVMDGGQLVPPNSTASDPSSRSTSPFDGRISSAFKAQLLAKYGGGDETERAVTKALTWLANHQLSNGSWNLDLEACPECRGTCGNGSTERNGAPTAATSLALLCFLGAGHTHLTPGPFTDTVRSGLVFLANAANDGNGQCYTKPEDMYSQGLATLTLAEAYGMTRHQSLEFPLKKTVAFIVVSQDPQGGGWRYNPRQAGDMSVTGWQLTALTIAAENQVDVPDLTFAKASFFLDSLKQHGIEAYGYSHREDRGSTSAIGLFCRGLLGWQSHRDAVRKGLQKLVAFKSTRDLYFQYYATNAFRRDGGPLWHEWHPPIRSVLLENQKREGHELGSWYDELTAGYGSSIGGRLYCTALATLILESYYRYAYPHDFEEPS